MKAITAIFAISLLSAGCSTNPERTDPSPSQTTAPGVTDDQEASEDVTDTTGEAAPQNQPESEAEEDGVADHAAGHRHGEHAHRHHRFDEPAKYADRWNDPARDAWQKPTEVIELGKISAGMTVADIGTGTGYFVPHLSSAVGPDGKVWALDLEQAMVDYVQKTVADEGLANVETKKIEATGPGVSGVDRFLLVNTWHHISERADYAQKLNAALKPGGAVIIVDYAPDASLDHGPPPHMRLEAQRVASELKAGGLEPTVVDETLPRQYVVVGHKR